METVNAPHLPVRENWLALHHEKALMPDLAIVDAHHHLWDRQSGRYLVPDFSHDILRLHRECLVVSRLENLVLNIVPDRLKFTEVQIKF